MDQSHLIKIISAKRAQDFSDTAADLRLMTTALQCYCGTAVQLRAADKVGTEGLLLCEAELGAGDHMTGR